MVVTKWKGGRGKRRKVEEPLDALEKLLRDIRANYPSEPTGSPAAVPTTTSTGDQRVTKEAEENVNEAGQPSKGVLRGYLRSTSVWVYVEASTAECFNMCCIGRLMPSSEPDLRAAYEKEICGSSYNTYNHQPSEREQLQQPAYPDLEQESVFVHEEGAQNQDQGNLNLVFEQTLNPPQKPCSCYRLSLEEAFFLLHCLECLQIYDSPLDHTTGPKTVQECWTLFIDLQPRFLLSYISYQHFRSQGYIVKSGIYYGCNHVLYTQHPSVSHAAFCVFTILQSSGNKQAGKRNQEEKEKEGLRYEDMQSLVRVCVNVAKKLVLLYVFYPEAGAKQIKEGSEGAVCNMKDVNMLPLVEVDEIKVSRWIPGESEG